MEAEIRKGLQSFLQVLGFELDHEVEVQSRSKVTVEDDRNPSYHHVTNPDAVQGPENLFDPLPHGRSLSTII